MHVCHQQKRIIYIKLLPIHISIDQTPAAYGILLFFTCKHTHTHTQLYEANEQFRNGIVNIRNEEKNKIRRNFIYGACLFVYQLQITIYQQQRRATAATEGERQLSRSNNMNVERVIFIKY